MISDILGIMDTLYIICIMNYGYIRISDILGIYYRYIMDYVYIKYILGIYQGLWILDMY